MKKLAVFAFLFLCGTLLAHPQGANPITNPHVTFVNSNGQPCWGCTFSSYAAGTSTALATYRDENHTIANQNPLTLGATGGADVWMLANTSYRLRLVDANNTVVWDIDNITAGGGGGSSISLTTNGTSGLSTLIGGVLNIPNYTPPVTSVFGRTGAVVAAANDYSFSQISGTAASSQLPLATTSAFGAIKPDGTSCTTTAGVLSCSGGGGSGNPFSVPVVAPSFVGPATINIVGAGDSRMANSSNGGGGGGAIPGADFISQVIQQPQFSGRFVSATNLAIGGSQCSGSMNLPSRVNAVLALAPNGTTVTKTLLFIEEGINDLTVGGGGTGISAVALEVCYQDYINQVTVNGTNGIIPILNTVYYSSIMTDAQDTQRQIFNDWIRSRPYLVIDLDEIVPSAQISPLNAGYNTPAAVSGYTIASQVGTFNATNSFVGGTSSVYLSGFPSTSSCLNNTVAPVVSATSTTFTIATGCPAATSSDVGQVTNAAVPLNSFLHMGAYGIALWAKAANDRYAAAGIGTTFAPSLVHDYINPPSAKYRINACLSVGLPPTQCNNLGDVYSINSATSGEVWFGGDNSARIARGATGSWVWTLGTSSSTAQVAITGATGGFTYTGGSIAACVTGAACNNSSDGSLSTKTSADGTAGLIHYGTSSFQQTASSGNNNWLSSGPINWTVGGAGVSLNNVIKTTAYGTATNCAAGSGGTCLVAPAGTVLVPAAATTLTVTTSIVAANSEIQLTYTTAASGCTTAPTNIATLGPAYVSTIVPATSFTITLPVAPATTGVCVSYNIIN